jgi:hypothetical protein
MIAKHPPPLSLVVDTILVLTADDYTALAKLGFRARLGYLDVVKPDELAACLDAGLGFAPIGYAHESNGLAARAEALKLPEGVTVYQDCEAETGPAESVIARVNDGSKPLVASGFQPGGYFGAQSLLTSAELTSLAVSTYWKGCSRVVDRFGNAAEPTRGYALLQGRPFNTVIVNGKIFDVSFLTADYHDDLPTFAYAG